MMLEAIIVILLIVNGINCVIGANINRNILVKLGKRKSILGLSTPNDFIDLYKAVKSNKELKKYWGFIYYITISIVFEMVLIIGLLIIMTF